MAESLADPHSSESSDDNDTQNLQILEKQLQEVRISKKPKKPWTRVFSTHQSKPEAEKETRAKIVSSVSVLVTAVTVGDVERSRQLMDMVSKRALNRLVSVEVNEGMFMVTPLLWAVVHSRVDIVRLLVERGVSTDRQGYLVNDDVRHTYTPLMRALDNGDQDIVGILLKAGADPYMRVSGPRLTEEEGGCQQYTSWLYPVTKAIATDNVEIVHMFMQHYDPSTLYTNHDHTCLCLALCKHKLTNWYDIISCIISYGGNVCSGSRADNQDRPKDQGMCQYFKLLIRHAFSLVYSNNDTRVECNFDSYKILALVCKTDYNRPQSSIRKALKQYLSLFQKCEFKEECGFVNKRSYECFLDVTRFCRSPSPLKQICRVTVRDCIRRISPEKIDKLPLPKVLQKYVGFLDDI